MQGDNGQAGIRYVYLVFGGDKAATTAVQLFVFQKSVRYQNTPANLDSRKDEDTPDEPQAKVARG